MAQKFSEMIALRVDLAFSVEAGFKSYLDEIAGRYADFLASVVRNAEEGLDAVYHMVLLRRSVKRLRLELEQLDESIVEQTHEDDKVRAEATRRRDAVDAKLRQVRSTCRGIYGPESLKRIGIAGLFPRGSARLHRLGLLVQSNLKQPDLGVEPLLKLSFGEDVPNAPAQLAGQLEPELEQLGTLVQLRHRERTKTVGLRLHRREQLEEFDDGIRGIVRIAQGMSRLAGHDELGKRFRPILSRTLRKLKEQEAEEGAGAENAEAPEGGEAEASQSPQEAASEETSA